MAQERRGNLFMLLLGGVLLVGAGANTQPTQRVPSASEAEARPLPDVVNPKRDQGGDDVRGAAKSADASDGTKSLQLEARCDAVAQLARYFAELSGPPRASGAADPPPPSSSAATPPSSGAPSSVMTISSAWSTPESSMRFTLSSSLDSTGSSTRFTVSSSLSEAAPSASAVGSGRPDAAPPDHGKNPTPRGAPPPAEAPGGGLRELVRAARQFVVLAPDPIDSGLPYSHDRVLSAVNLAMLDTGHQRIVGWTPWQTAPVTPKAPIDCRFGSPGLILYDRGS